MDGDDDGKQHEQLPCFPFFFFHFALWLAKKEGKLMQLVLGVVVLLLVTSGLDVHEGEDGGWWWKGAQAGGGQRRWPQEQASLLSMVKVGFGIDGLLPYGSRGMERLMSCDGFDEPPKRLQQQHPTHGHGSPTAIPSHPILRRRTSYCSTMHGHGLGLGSTTAVAPLRASPPTPGTTTAIPALRFPFPLNWVGARTRPLFFFYPLFLSPILV